MKNESINNETKKVEKTNEKFSLKEQLKSKLDNINLQSVSTKKFSEKKSIYKYAEGLVSDDAKKTFRRKMRSKTDFLLFAILHTFKNANSTPEEKNKVCKEFNSFYKENFVLNDFTFESISESRKDEKKNYYSLALEIVKENETK